jgi:hypothetical protein
VKASVTAPAMSNGSRWRRLRNQRARANMSNPSTIASRTPDAPAVETTTPQPTPMTASAPSSAARNSSARSLRASTRWPSTDSVSVLRSSGPVGTDGIGIRASR